ncbi:hypothetical protein [Dyadobacter chenhuakuii]|uniref:Uncharacterized protein n=1 Tax=Dyadobacter chenhuakuii TaxID=2909339 RepID=A0A9X1QBX0_9BACT|nr:hypothetical protein [Dyadobacter chenhuakuii]MCF2495129.1 hypothetical protein [Dyadobacter chenhuakuii]MCF2498209.1 hypothetical protein [Dyadobacter chenhuakuii]USJ31560.1 hypothetical protein NFI80_02220 [Dyadobacter chenhuakuii]
MAKKNLKASYQKMLEWNQYRAEENSGSLKKLLRLLSELDRESEADETYEKDIDDLESLKFIYETGIRKFESQVDKYKALIAQLP